MYLSKHTKINFSSCSNLASVVPTYHLFLNLYPLQYSPTVHGKQSPPVNSVMSLLTE